MVAAIFCCNCIKIILSIEINFVKTDLKPVNHWTVYKGNSGTQQSYGTQQSTPYITEYLNKSSCQMTYTDRHTWDKEKNVGGPDFVFSNIWFRLWIKSNISSFILKFFQHLASSLKPTIRDDRVCSTETRDLVLLPNTLSICCFAECK